MCHSSFSNRLLWPLSNKDLDYTVWFLSCVCMLLIFLWSRISEVSDYVSIKHIHCPAINALIAEETENVLGSFNNGVLFIRGHSDTEVGKPCNLSTLQSHTDHNYNILKYMHCEWQCEVLFGKQQKRGNKQ